MGSLKLAELVQEITEQRKAFTFAHRAVDAKEKCKGNYKSQKVATQTYTGIWFLAQE